MNDALHRVESELSASGGVLSTESAMEMTLQGAGHSVCKTTLSTEGRVKLVHHTTCMVAKKVRCQEHVVTCNGGMWKLSVLVSGRVSVCRVNHLPRGQCLWAHVGVTSTTLWVRDTCLPPKCSQLVIAFRRDPDDDLGSPLVKNPGSPWKRPPIPKHPPPELTESCHHESRMPFLCTSRPASVVASELTRSGARWFVDQKGQIRGTGLKENIECSNLQ